MTYPELLAGGIVHVFISGHDKILRKIEELQAKRDRVGTEKLNKHEWALLHILEQADMAINTQSYEFDAEIFREEFLEKLSDEEDAAWEPAFDNALDEVKTTYLVPHPDSL